MPLSVQVKVEIPELIFNSAVVREKLAQKQRTHTAPHVKGLFYQTTVGWKQRPGFQQNQAVTRDYVAIRIFTKSKRYGLVTRGSPAHMIRPRKGGLLRFKPGYKAATRPRILRSRAPQRFGDYVTAGAVKHPGFEGRDFDIEVAEQAAPKFEKDMQDVIKNISVFG